MKINETELSIIKNYVQIAEQFYTDGKNPAQGDVEKLSRELYGELFGYRDAQPERAEPQVSDEEDAAQWIAENVPCLPQNVGELVAILSKYIKQFSESETRHNKDALIILSELIILKGYKDQHGKDKYYLYKQPKLWERAENIILKIDLASLQSPHPKPISEERIEEGAESYYYATDDFKMSNRKIQFGKSAFANGVKWALKELELTKPEK
jgi:hypothetical protein